MSLNSLESIPQCWSEQDDVPFFCIVAALFPPAFTYGAGVLLATNADRDDESAEIHISPISSAEVPTKLNEAASPAPSESAQR